MGTVTEIMYMQKFNRTCKIKKIDSEKYIDLKTGEIMTFKAIQNRSEDKNSVRVSLSKLRDYLNTNIQDVSCCRWVTLTYAENMTDTKRLYIDFKNFNKRLRYHMGNYEYIVAMEPQGRGAWHCHVVMIFGGQAPYIPNKELSEIWGHGFVTVKRLEDVDNVGAYLTAYLGDMELEEYTKEFGFGDIKNVKEVEIKDENGIAQSKYVVKGARLNMYPPKFNLYRCSRGIKKPKIYNTKGFEAEKKISADTLTFERTITLYDEKTDYNNTINYRYYNSKRTASQENKNNGGHKNE